MNNMCIPINSKNKSKLIQLNLCKTATLKKTKKKKKSFQDRLLFNAGQKYRRMLQREHAAIHLTFIKLRVVIKILNVLSIFEWPFYTSFTVCLYFFKKIYITCIRGGL